MKSTLLLFVHGLGSTSKKTWKDFSLLVTTDAALSQIAEVQFFDFKTTKFRWPTSFSRKQSVSDLAIGLRTEIEDRHGDYEKIVLVGHSMGGLVIRQYLLSEVREGRRLRANKALLFAVPNQGSEVAAIAGFFSFVHTQLADLTPGSPFLENLNRDWRKLKLDGQVEITHVVAGLDKAVTKPSAVGLWGDENVKLVPDKSHSGLVAVETKSDLSFLILRNAVLREGAASPEQMPSTGHPDGAPSQPSGEPGTISSSALRSSLKGTAVLTSLADWSSAELIDRVLSSSLSLLELNDAVRQHPDDAADLLESLGRRLSSDSSTWLRMLAAQVASQINNPGQIAIKVGFDDSHGWGTRQMAISWLRFSTRETRTRDAASLYEHSSTDDPDAARLVIAGMGFLANSFRIADVFEAFGGAKTIYGSEKLGSAGVKSYLNCFIHDSDELQARSALSRMSELYRMTEALGQMHLSELNYFPLLHPLSPGRATNLLDHVSKNAHVPILAAVLQLLKDRSNRNALPRLQSILNERRVPDSIRTRVVEALGRIRSPEGVEASMAYARTHPDELSGALLSIGTNRTEAHREMVLGAFASGSAARATACWALGELARSGDAALVRMLRQESHQPEDGISRAVAWLGLAKAGAAISLAELEEAAEGVTSYAELVVLGIAAAECGHISVLSMALAAAQSNLAPIWRLEGHLFHDYRLAFAKGGSPWGATFLGLLNRGDLA